MPGVSKPNVNNNLKIKNNFLDDKFNVIVSCNNPKTLDYIEKGGDKSYSLDNGEQYNLYLSENFEMRNPSQCNITYTGGLDVVFDKSEQVFIREPGDIAEDRVIYIPQAVTHWNLKAKKASLSSSVTEQNVTIGDDRPVTGG